MRMVLVSTHKADNKLDRDEWLDYQLQMNRGFRDIEEEADDHAYTTTELRSYPSGMCGVSLTGWWIDQRAVFYLKSREVV